jgi:hypothetical protein
MGNYKQNGLVSQEDFANRGYLPVLTSMPGGEDMDPLGAILAQQP